MSTSPPGSSGPGRAVSEVWESIIGRSSGENSLRPLADDADDLSPGEHERKRRPLPLGGANFDLAPERAGKAPREHEADARARVALALARVELMKFLEELRQVVLRDPAPGVRHGDPNLTRRSSQRENDLSTLCEFYRVRQEVEQDLSHSLRVTHRLDRDVRNVDDQPNVLPCSKTV